MDQDLRDDLRTGRKIGVRIFLFLLIIAGIIFAVRLCTKTAVDATHAEDAVIVYEEFQEIYNTCEKLNEDICNMKEIPEDDPMFSQFSKAQRVLAIKTNLNRWVEDYNAKSKMWGRSLWKSEDLPYKLAPDQFSCY